MVDPIQALGPVHVQQHSHPAPVRGRRNLLKAGPLKLREGPDLMCILLLIEGRPLAEGTVILDGPDCSGWGLHGGECTALLGELCGRPRLQIHTLHLRDVLSRHPGIRHVARGVEGARVPAQAVGVIFRDRLNANEAPLPRLHVDPVEAPSHVVAVQVGDDRVLVEPVGTPVVASISAGDGLSVRERPPRLHLALVARPQRRAEGLIDAAGPLSQSRPQPDPEPQEGKPVVEGRCLLKERRARRVPALGPRLEGVGAADVKAIERLCIPGGLHHLGERPRLVRQHRRPHFHGKEGRIQPACPLFEPAFSKHRNPFHEAPGRCEVARPGRVRREKPNQISVPESGIDLRVRGVHEFVGPHQCRPGRRAGDEGVVPDARGLNFLPERKRRDEPVRPVRKAIHHDRHVDGLWRQAHEAVRPRPALAQGPSNASRCVFLALLHNEIEVAPGHGSVLGRGRAVGDLIQIGVQLGDALRPSRDGAEREHPQQKGDESPHDEPGTKGDNHTKLGGFGNVCACTPYSWFPDA